MPNNRQYILFFHIILFCCIFHSSNSQHYSFKTYTTAQGLASNQVYAICQDSKGYIWFGTNGRGVSKFDGKSFENYTTKDGLISNVINSIYQDSKGYLWFCTDDGLARINLNQGSELVGSKYTFENFTIEDGLNDNKVMSMIEDKNGKLLFGTGKGLNIYEQGAFNNAMSALGSDPIRTILEDNMGNLWFGTEGFGVIKFDGMSFVRFTEKDGLKGHFIFSLLEDKSGNIWFGSSVGISYYNSAGLIAYDNSKNGKFNALLNRGGFTMTNDKEGNIWLGSWGKGLLKFDGENYVSFTEQEGLGNNNVYSTMIDQEGNLWVSTYGGGVSRFSIRSYEIFNTKNGLPSNFIWSVVNDYYGNIWIGTNNGASVAFNKSFKSGSLISVGLGSENQHTTIYSILKNTDGTVWLGTEENGIYNMKFNQKSNLIEIIQKVSTNNGLPDSYVRAIYQDKKDNLWIGTQTGVAVININDLNASKYKFKVFTIESGLINNLAYSIVEDKHGNIWFGTGTGVSKYNGQFFENFSANESGGLVNNDVRTVLVDRDGKLWFGTGGGVSVFDPETKEFDNLTTKDGLSSDRLYLMHFDEQDTNTLWIGTNFGLDKFNYGEYRKTGKKIFKHLTHLDGFIELETNTNAICQDENGNLWIGTVNGLIKYDPKFIKPKNELEPITSIVNISISRKDTALADNSSLPHYLSHISFQFSGISHTMPEKVKYQYKLDGFDEDWSPETKERYASYANLGPGDYTFKVKACNNDGVWNKVPVTFNFTITPAFWQTWWFYILCFLTGGSGIFGFVKIREKNLQREKRILEEKVETRTKQLTEEKEITEQAKIDIEEKNKKLWKVNMAIHTERENVEKIKVVLEEKNKDITDSIKYAQSIQHAILPHEQEITKSFPNHFIYFVPRDIVSGDFYWYAKQNDKAYIAVCDCTGHGVPGAFVSMIGNNLLNQIIIEKNISDPGEILSMLSNGIKSAFTREGSDQKVNDGMDMTLCSFNMENGNLDPSFLEFAGAQNHLFLVRNGEVIETKGDRQPIGGRTDSEFSFTTHKIELHKEDTLYMLSDGYADQFGGDKDKKFMIKRFKKLISELFSSPMKKQKEILDNTITEWRGEHDQIDDILVVGVRI